MASAMRSARQAAMSDSNPISSQTKSAPSATTKRKADPKGAPQAKRGKKSNDKKQISIEAAMPGQEKEGASEDVDMQEETGSKSAEPSNGVEEVANRREEIGDQENMDEEGTKECNGDKKGNTTNGTTQDEGEKEPEKNGFDAIMKQDDTDNNITEEGAGSKVSAAENAVEDSAKRQESTPSNILEKGIIYFFFRGRVGITEPSKVNDIARSYIVLRPIPHGAKLGEGPIGDVGNVRMLALPKKVLPVSPKDRFMTFVEKANASMEDGTYLLEPWFTCQLFPWIRKSCGISRETPVIGQTICLVHNLAPSLSVPLILAGELATDF